MLKLQYFGHLIRRADSFDKTLMLGKIEGTCVCVRVWARVRTHVHADAYICLCRFVWVESMTQSSRKCDGWVDGGWVSNMCTFC